MSAFDAWLVDVDEWPALTPEQRDLLERSLAPVAEAETKAA